MKAKSYLVLGLGYMALLIGCQSQTPQQGGQTDYPLLTLKPENRQLSVKYSAVIEGKQDVEVRPQVSGTITEVCVKEGARVSKGQVLFVIDQVPYLAALKQAEASVATAEANEATAKLTLEGKESLYKDKVISDFELRTARNNYQSAQASLMQAQAELVNARNNLSYTEIKSPVDGYAGMTSYRIGALVTYGSLDSTLLSFPPIQLELNDGSVYQHTGKIDVISGLIDKTTGTVSLRAVFDNQEKRLMSGGSANVIIPYERQQCLVIPQGGTYEIQNRIFAYKVVDGKAESTPIEVFEINDGKEYIVEDGLQAGDVIVSEGAGLLKDGAIVAASAVKPNTEEE